MAAVSLKDVSLDDDETTPVFARGYDGSDIQVPIREELSSLWVLSWPIVSL